VYAIGENPVLQRELLVNLRTLRSFVLLGVYQIILALVVYVAWPKESWLDLTSNPESTRQLVDLFFLGNYIIVSLMTPTFAAGAITGEKERKTLEMLLASPLHPMSIVGGKLAAALTHLAIVVMTSLPVVMLCLPLGGVSIYEVLAAYVGLISSVVMFGMISVAAGSFFKRTSAALVVSYLVILPVVLMVIAFWYFASNYGERRILWTVSLLPAISAAISIPLYYLTTSRLLYPPDLGGQTGMVLDLEQESERSVGLVINREQFPDRLFVPPIRKSLMEDGTNPVYDKEMRSEIFGQGTLMLRLAIQISMMLAIILMAVCLYMVRALAPWYICYVILFNLMIGPVFSAGSVTSERERQTLDLLLTTMISPWKILWGKFFSGLRVSTVLTSFLLWPVLLAAIMVPDYWQSLLSVGAYLVIVALTCVTTANIALLCSSVFRRTSTSLVVTYVILLTLFVAPVAADFFAERYFPETRAAEIIDWCTASSPFAAAHQMPIFVDDYTDEMKIWKRPTQMDSSTFLGYYISDLKHVVTYVLFTILLNMIVFAMMIWMFHARWRVSQSS
jgi:ABC-type transport system involved in multi-copper enzyme maturation permease subunit